MKKVISIVISLLIVIFITGCNDKKENKNIRVIDFSEYNIEEVIEWGFENNCIQKFNFEYKASNDIERNKVISQSLNAGEILKDNILLVISNGTLVQQSGESIQIPNILGKSLSEAKAELEALGFAIGDVKYTKSSEDKDIVLFSDPLPGTVSPKTTKINLTVSSGENIDRKFSIDLDFTGIVGERNIKVYIDGEIKRAYTKIVNESVSNITLTLSGSGIKSVKIKVNDETIYSKDIDFTNGKEL